MKILLILLLLVRVERVVLVLLIVILVMPLAHGVGGAVVALLEVHLELLLGVVGALWKIRFKVNKIILTLYPSMLWMASWAESGLSKLTKP